MSGWIALLTLTAFTSGVMGGVHCSAMCGALAGVACGGTTHAKHGLLFAAHVGRLTSYAVTGALAGVLGQSGLALRGGVPAQQAWMAVTGATLLLTALYMLNVGRVVQRMEAVGAIAWRKVSPLAQRVLPVDSTGKALAMGALWGWLPCGMVYAALMLAMAAGTASAGALVMLAFGAGTLPALLDALQLLCRATGINP